MAAAAQVRTQAPATTVAGPLILTGSRSGTAYKLGQEIGAGGNGIVYAVSLRPELVAKVSRHLLSQHDVEKLEALAGGTTPELLSVAAWPIDCLRDAAGWTVGFVMPRILEARPLHELYSPRPRVQHFPSADFRFLVHVAANVARLFAAVHKAGFICGDVNHSNILIRQNGTVAAVDCDSFQVGDGTRFPCLVGTELFVPPELMGAALGATPRTANHDNFGLAVLVFHLLFMGRHPFAGRFLGRGEMPIERAIVDCRFAYSRDAKRTELAPPPFTLPMTAVGPAVTELFERAFHPDGRHGGRPTPETWIDALDALKASLVACRKVAWHQHTRATPNCPWCAIEVPAKVKLFGGLIRVAVAGIADLDTLWARYLALVDPGPPQPLPKRSVWVRQQIQVQAQPQTQVPRRTRNGRRRLLSALLPEPKTLFKLALYGFSLATMIALDPNLKDLKRWIVERVTRPPAQLWGALEPYMQPLAPIFADGWTTILAASLLVLAVSLLGSLRASASILVRDAGRLALATLRLPRSLGRWWTARVAWSKATAAWKSQMQAPEVSDLRAAIEQVKSDVDALAAEREARLQAAAVPQPAAEQLARHLGQFRIEAAKLTNIGPARCAVLRSWGIDTAADVDEAKIAEIPGFGRALTDKLVIWREMKEKSFTPSTSAVVDPLEVARIDRQLAARRAALMKELRDRIAELERRLGEYSKARVALWAGVEAANESRTGVRNW